MSDKLVILSMETVSPYSGYREVMVGLEVDEPQDEVRLTQWFHARLTIASKKKLNDWAKANGRPVPRTRNFTIFGTVGRVDTPELLAYDEIDQQEDEPGKRPAARKRRITKK